MSEWENSRESKSKIKVNGINWNAFRNSIKTSLIAVSLLNWRQQGNGQMETGIKRWRLPSVKKSCDAHSPAEYSELILKNSKVNMLQDASKSIIQRFTSFHSHSHHLGCYLSKHLTEIAYYKLD
jgi:hypothetical protein